MKTALQLSEHVLDGDRRALARLITQVENEVPAARAALAALYTHTGSGHIVGVTGAPGSGKSTLVNELAKRYRRLGRTVAIVAVDPTSPFSGGAVLGDRIRMRDLAGDNGVFIRSMASRGSLGGLARTTVGVVKVLDAAGFDEIVVETVGAGQSEVEIAKTAHTTVVVQSPGMGDDIQAIKAGILEIADVLVVNKADRPGADSTVRALEMMQRLGRDGGQSQPGRRFWFGRAAGIDGWFGSTTGQEVVTEEWSPPILQTVAISGVGVDELAAAVSGHWDYLRRSGELRMREAVRVEQEFDLLLRETLLTKLLARICAAELGATLARLLEREIDPYAAVEQLIAEGSDL